MLPDWFLRWLSVDVDALEGGTAKLRLARFPEGELGLLALLGVAALLGIVLLLYAREGAVPTWRKLLMAGLRCALILVTALIVFYPVLEVDRSRDLRATTIVLVDESSSMGIKDRYQGAPADREEVARLIATLEGTGEGEVGVDERRRADLVNRLLAHEDSRFLRELRSENLLEVYGFSAGLRPVSAGKGAASEDGSEPSGTRPEGPPPGPRGDEPPESGGEETGAATPEEEVLPVPSVAIEPAGHATDIAAALRTAVEQQGGGRVAAVVLVSDGRATAGERVAGAAEFLRQQDIPVHAVGVGDPTEPRNFRITTLLANEKVFAGDPVNVEVRVSQRGYDGEEATVELVDELGEEPGGAATKVLGSETIVFTDGSTEGSASFRVELEGLGRHRLTARVAPRPEEVFEDDNSRTEVVEVVEEASRALLIAGAPSWEYRFLKNLLRRDRRVFLAAWLMSADPDYPQEGNTSLERLPAEARELFEYDVILLLDVDPDALPPGYPELLQRFVGKHRGGLFYVAGEKYTTQLFRSPRMRPLTDMLPVVPDLAQAESERSSSPFHEREWPLVPARAAAGHAATRLSSRPDRNRQRWGELSGAYWSYPVRKAKAGATVLLTHQNPRRVIGGDPQPVLAWQYWEGGRVLYLGTDESWRWRSYAREIYEQFWVQSMRYLTESRLMGGKRQLLQTESESYDLGDAVRVSALILDESYKPVERESETVTIERPDGERTEVVLDRDPSSAGWYRGTFVPRALGDHTIRLADGTVKLVRVEPPDLEFQEPRLDRETLAELAERTGGSYTPVWEAFSVPEKIPDRRRRIVTTDEPILLWDNWFSLGVLAGLLTLEWILRKWNRLL